jgi:hypothetical protein
MNNRKRKVPSTDSLPNLFHAFQSSKAVQRRAVAAGPQPAVMDATAVSGSAEEGGGGGDGDGFLSAACCCTVCHEIKPASAFYASNLRRSVFYCKQCSAAKSKAAKRPAVAAAAAPARSRKTSTAADNLLDRLRRMCARPQECGLRQLLQQPISLDFDVRVARMLLPVWNDRSALSLTSVQQQQQHQQQQLEGQPPLPSLALRLVPWYKQDMLPLRPWEVIPLTRAEARRLCAIPLHLWERCLQPECVAAINSKLAALKRMLLDEQSQQQ